MIDESGKLFFSVDARHLRQLGRELVADRTTALAELIKNAYDADATTVVVNFVDPAKGGRLEITDDGSGMTLDDIKECWMRLSTDRKHRFPRTDTFRRVRAGEKGIGRFATESLGAALELRTKTVASATRVVAEFDWRSFETSNQRLEEIPATYRIESAPQAEHGTGLIIDGLHDAWTSDDLDRVRRAVLLLQPPFPIAKVLGLGGAGAPSDQEDPGFQVTIRFRKASSGNPTDPSQLLNETRHFLAAATAVVAGEVTESGEATWSVESTRLGLSDRRSYREKLLLTGPLRFEAAYYVYSPDAIGDIGLRLAKEMGNQYGGIRVYRDRIRIPPYGDQRNDWLGLDELYRRRSILPPVQNLSWFGQVHLSRSKNPLITDTASREGVVENEAFEELRKLLRHCLIQSALSVARVRHRKETAAKRELPLTRTELVGRATRLAREVLGTAGGDVTPLGSSQIDKQASDLERQARAADTLASKHEKALLGEIALLQVLASLGTSITVFSHEVRSAINVATSRLADIEEECEPVSEPLRSRLFTSLGSARESTTRLAAIARYVDAYASQSRRRERSPVPVFEVLRDFAHVMGPLAERNGAKLQWRVSPQHLRTAPMARSELEAILINMLTNALKATHRTEGGEKRILVTGDIAGGKVLLRFQDNGCGIDPEIRDILFQPFAAALDAGDPFLGPGTGLGLKIVSDIVGANDGEVRIGTPDPGFSTCFDIEIPLWDGLSEEEGT